MRMIIMGVWVERTSKVNNAPTFQPESGYLALADTSP